MAFGPGHARPEGPAGTAPVATGSELLTFTVESRTGKEVTP